MSDREQGQALVTCDSEVGVGGGQWCDNEVPPKGPCKGGGRETLKNQCIWPRRLRRKGGQAFRAGSVLGLTEPLGTRKEAQKMGGLKSQVQPWGV
jgi:hypothetical protein